MESEKSSSMKIRYHLSALELFQLLTGRKKNIKAPLNNIYVFSDSDMEIPLVLREFFFCSGESEKESFFLTRLIPPQYWFDSHQRLRSRKRMAVRTNRIQELSCIEDTLQRENYCIIAQDKASDWYAGIRLDQMGQHDPPVFITWGDKFETWEVCTEALSSFLLLLLMHEISGGRYFHRILLTEENTQLNLRKIETEGEAAGTLLAGYVICVLEQTHSVLFLTKSGTDQTCLAMKAEPAQAEMSEQAWYSSYLLSNLEKCLHDKLSPLEPFSLQGYMQKLRLCQMESACIHQPGRMGKSDFPELQKIYTAEERQNIRICQQIGKAVKDLSPLIPFTELREVILPHNQISDLSPLQGLSKLQTLTLTSNRIASLSPLQELRELTYLNLSDNPVTSGELFFLKKLKRLKSLLLGNTKIDDLSPLQGYRGFFLDISGNPGLIHLETLSSMSKLKSMIVDEQVISYDQIQKLLPQMTFWVKRNGMIQFACMAYMN